MNDNLTAENQTPTPRADAQSDAPAPRVAQPSRPSFPAWYDYLVLMVLFAISQMVLAYVAMKCGYTVDLARHIASPPADYHAPSDPSMGIVARATALGYIAGMASMVFMTLVYRRLRGGRGRVARFSPRGFDPALLLDGFVVVLAANVVVEPLTELLPGTPDYNMLGRGSWALLSTVVCAPLFEEFLFRGVILEAARRRRGVVAGWLISSLCFGLAHGLPSQMLPTAIIGLVLGYVCIRSGSLFGGIVLHALNNALAMLLLILGYGDTTLSSLVGQKTYWAIYAVAAFIFVWWAVSAVRTIVAMRRNERMQQ